jgi:hypothetical protein
MHTLLKKKLGSEEELMFKFLHTIVIHVAYKYTFALLFWS